MTNKKMRRSPKKHVVKAHKRRGFVVHSYVRGDGTKVKHIKKPLIGGHHKKQGEPKGYTVKFRYTEKPRDWETVHVISTSYDRALDEAYEEKKDPRNAIEVHIIDPLLGDIISIVTGGAKDVAGKVGSKVKSGAKAAGHRAKQHVIDSIEERAYNREVEGLIRKAYDKDKGKSTHAKALLKAYYPDVWNIMDVSRRKTRSPAPPTIVFQQPRDYYGR